MVFQPLRYFTTPKFSAVENGAAGENAMASNKGSLKDFLLSIASMTGDLSNITAPPFVLDTKSVVEIPSFWAENPAVFVQPALSEDPAERAMHVLKSFLAGMKSQCYMGHSEEEGVKKPLNAFLGEIFLGHWEDPELGNTYLCSEQISHHPPITACRVWNPKHGVIAEGFNRQKVTFSWSHMAVHISSQGFAMKTIEKYDEHYLIPLPNFKVKGVLSGAPYPETDGEWYIPSTNGYMSKIDFSGKGGFFSSGKKHEFSAVLYKEADGPSKPIYTAEGCWNTEFTIRDERSGKVIETVNIKKASENLPPLHLPSLDEMDPWETRRAWHDTKEAIQANDFGRVSAAKSFLEQGQRSMRKEEEKNGAQWKQLFFKNTKSNDIAAKLMAKIPGLNYEQALEDTKGVWAFNAEAYENADRPFHPGLEPDNLKEGEERVYKNGRRGSFQASPSATPRGSIDGARPRLSMSEAPRRSVDVQDRDMPRQSLEARHKRVLDEKLGAVEDGRKASVNGTLMDVGRQPEKKEIDGITKNQPEPQTNQLRNKEEELGSGVEGLTVKDKVAVEDMLRETYSSGNSR